MGGGGGVRPGHLRVVPPGNGLALRPLRVASVYASVALCVPALLCSVFSLFA